MRKRILITGSSGMLGKDLVDIFSRDKKYCVFGLSRHKIKNNSVVSFISFDLNKLTKLKKVLDEIKPGIIIHSAALVNVDRCEDEHRAADALHVKATKILATYEPLKTKFIYISTDSVFDGRKSNYREDSKPGPLNYYAASKLRGEKEALKSNRNSLVIRTNIYGFHIPSGQSLVEKTLNSLDKNELITGFQDVIFNPVYTKHLAVIIKKLIEKKNSPVGILNVAVDESVSKYDFLRNLAKIFNKNIDLIRPGFIKDIKLKAPRPKNTSLNNSELKKIIHSVPSLSKGFKDLKKDYLEIYL